MTEFGRVITQNEHNLHNGNFQFIESAAQILRRKKQRIAFLQKVNNLHRKPAEIL